MAALSFTTTKTVKQTSTDRLLQVDVPVKKLVYILLDASGSMAGAKFRRALRGVKGILDVMGSGDHFVFTVFNDTVHEITSRRPKFSVVWEKAAQLAEPLCGGGTQLWGAVEAAMDDIKHMPRAHDVHVDLVVLTDGEDNRSGRGSADKVKADVARPGFPNFHMIFLACGTDTAPMQRIGHGVSHVKVFEEAEADSEAISRALGRAKTFIIERKTTTTTTTQTGSGKGGVIKRVEVTEKKSFLTGGKGNQPKPIDLTERLSAGGCEDQRAHGQKHRGSNKMLENGSGGGGGGGGGGDLKPIHKDSILGRNIATLLREARGGEIAAAKFQQEYTDRFGMQLDLKDGKLGALLRRCEAGGACRLENRGAPLFVLRA
jgi:hypothetical protein